MHKLLLLLIGTLVAAGVIRYRRFWDTWRTVCPECWNWSEDTKSGFFEGELL